MNVTQYLSSPDTPVQQSATEFWQQCVGNCSIPLIALDMISAPASQALYRDYTQCVQYDTIRYDTIRYNQRPVKCSYTTSPGVLATYENEPMNRDFKCHLKVLVLVMIQS